MTTDTIEAPAEATPSADSASKADDAHPQTLPQGEGGTDPQQQPAQGGEPAQEATKDDDPAEAVRKVQQATQRRISRLVAERAQERARADLLAQQIAALQGSQPAAEQGQPRQADPDAIRREAQAIVEAQRFNETCNALVAKGKAAFPDFEASLSSLTTVTGPLLDERGRPEPLLTAVLDGADDPARVLHHLAQHPDIAADLLDLPATRQAARIARLEAGLKEPARKPSQAPAPLTPVKAVAADTSGEPDPSDAGRWIAWRNAQSRGTRPNR